MAERKDDYTHWGHEDARPTSLHGNGSSSFERVTVDWSKVTCPLCQSLRPSETRARKRIRLAVESRGFNVIEMEWEPWYNAGEMSGIGGGWTVLTDRPYEPGTNYGNDAMGLSAAEVIAWIDYFYTPAEPCGCYPGARPAHSPLNPGKDGPQRPVHQPQCRWFLDYRLPWWPKDGGA